MPSVHKSPAQLSILTVTAQGLLLLVLNDLARAQSPITETALLLQALQTRANAVQSMDVRWEATTSYSAHYGEVLSNTPFDSKSGKPPASELFKPTEHSWTGRLAVQGSKIRLEDSKPIWSYPLGRFIARRMIECFDGSEDRRFREDVDKESGFPPRGFIRSTSDTREYVFIKLLLFYAEPLRDKSELRKLITTEPRITRDRIAGVECVTLSSDKSDSRRGTATAVSFCPDQDWNVTRVVRRREDTVLRDMHMHYHQQEDGKWVPREWRWNEFDTAGRLTASTKFRVTSLVLNKPCDDMEFTIQFPPGTRVEDQR